MSHDEFSLSMSQLQEWLGQALFDDANRLVHGWIKGKSLNTVQWVDVRNLLFNNLPSIKATPSLWLCLIRIEKLLGMRQAAFEFLNQLLQVYPNHPDGMRELGWIYSEQGQLQQAVHIFSRLIQLDRYDWMAWNDGGCNLRALGHTATALDWMKNACAALPENPNLFANLALLQYELHDCDAAQDSLNRAFELDPTNAEALHTQGMVAARLGQFEKAYEFEYKALGVKSNYPQVRLSLALLDLTQGRWPEGFAGYESRWVGADKSDNMPTIGRPQWRGHPVYPGTRIAILPEQGLGDHLQFARFIPKLLELFDHVDWVVPSSLFSLFANSFKLDNVTLHIEADTLPLHLIDFECPLMSLPLALGVTVDNLPGSVPYLNVEENFTRIWGERVHDVPTRLNVGLAWSGRPTLSAHNLRSVNPTALECLDHAEINFFNLQKSDSGSVQVPRMTHWYDWMDECHDFSATAALISHLDLVICADTSIAHMAGALGKQVWLLNRLGSEWRWLHNRNDSPWYPSMRLFNQQTFGEWDSTLAEVAIDLHRLVGSLDSPTYQDEFS